MILVLTFTPSKEASKAHNPKATVTQETRARITNFTLIMSFIESFMGTLSFMIYN